MAEALLVASLVDRGCLLSLSPPQDSGFIACRQVDGLVSLTACLAVWRVELVALGRYRQRRRAGTECGLLQHPTTFAIIKWPRREAKLMRAQTCGRCSWPT